MSASSILAELQAARADITALKTQVSTLQTMLSSKSAAPAAAESDGGKKVRKTKAKNPDAPKRPANSWISFTKRVRDLLKANGQTLAGTDTPMFCSELYEENKDTSSWSDADILARLSGWTRPTVSKQEAAGKNKKKGDSAAGSVADAAPVSDELEDEAADGAASAISSEKKRGPAKGTKWSEEKKAAAAAKRAATKAAKAGLLNDEPLGASAEEIREAAAAAVAKPPPSSFALPPSPKKATPPAAAGAGVAAAGGGATPMVFKNVLLDGKRYLVCLENGHAYNVAKDDEGNYVKNGDKYVQDSWAGIFHRTGGKPSGGPWLDSEVKDPNASADEEEELNFDE